MRVVVLYNRRSGQGQAQRLAEPLVAHLVASGRSVDLVEAGPGVRDDLANALRDAAALVVVGGDGTVSHAAPAAMAADKPIYHFPLGTENLFARQFHMTRSLKTLERALSRGRVVSADVGTCNGRTFLLMCSSGPDASIVQRVESARTAAAKAGRGLGGHLAYARPVFRELLRPTFPTLRIRVDGTTVVDAQRGILVVGNSRQYGVRIDPAFNADMTDGLLDVVFLPCRSRVAALWWALRARLRLHTRDKRCLYVRGREVVIEPLDGHAPLQVDGEAAGDQTAPLHLGIKPQACKVLLPG
jgi:diacylglycerol kinase (ATP)